MPHSPRGSRSARVLALVAVLVGLLGGWLAAAPAPRTPTAGKAALARTGHVAARTRRTLAGKTQSTLADLWFSDTRTRLTVSQGSAPATVQIFDGRSMYRWTQGAKAGQTWHPAGFFSVRDVVGPLLQAKHGPGRRRVGSARVAGTPCALYQGTVKASAGSWWKGSLKVRLWESTDSRFPFVLRSSGVDTSGNRVESEVTSLTLGTPVPSGLFRPSQRVAFVAPPQVRRGRRVAGTASPFAVPVALHLGDEGGGLKALGRRTVTFAGRRLVLDRKSLATERDVEEVRLEPYGDTLAGAQDALVFYLKPRAAARLSQASARAKGRRLVLLVAGLPVLADRIARPWPAEENRVVLFGIDGPKPAALAAQLGGR